MVVTAAAQSCTCHCCVITRRSKETPLGEARTRAWKPWAWVCSPCRAAEGPGGGGGAGSGSALRLGSWSDRVTKEQEARPAACCHRCEPSRRRKRDRTSATLDLDGPNLGLGSDLNGMSPALRQLRTGLHTGTPGLSAWEKARSPDILSRACAHQAEPHSDAASEPWLLSHLVLGLRGRRAGLAGEQGSRAWAREGGRGCSGHLWL